MVISGSGIFIVFLLCWSIDPALISGVFFYGGGTRCTVLVSFTLLVTGTFPDKAQHPLSPRNLLTNHQWLLVLER